MTTHSSRSNRAWLGTSFIAAVTLAACSLSVPSETDLFGGAGKAGSASGSSGEGGSPGGAGSPEGGKGGSKAGGAGEASGGTSDAGEGGTSDAGAAGRIEEPQLPPATLMLRYSFDDLTDFVAKDLSGNGHDGTLTGLSLPIAAIGHVGGALKLDGPQKQYVQLPNDLLYEIDGVSITVWIKLGQSLAWDRLFDFNSGESNWWYFSPTGWNDTSKSLGTRSATRTPSVLAPEIMMTEPVPLGEWHHIAVVFAKPYLRYYLDGELKSELNNMSFGPSALGKTNQTWIGRSVFATDPYLSALLDDFRMYTGALTAEQVAELAAQ